MKNVNFYNSRLTWLEITKPELFAEEQQKTSSTSYAQEKEVTEFNISKYRNKSSQGLRCFFKAISLVLTIIFLGCCYIAKTETTSDHPPTKLTADEVSDNLIPKTFMSWKQ